MSDLTRRGFVKGSAGAAAGLTMLTALLAETADAHPGSRPVIAWVKNANHGEIHVLAADREVTIHDRKLAARLARAVA